jgi:pyruvate/2-oxoglutarate/acetoin dehydrogenase E1 component
MNYREELTKSMTLLSENEKTIFLGQSILYKGTAMFNTLKNVPNSKKIEMPVAEELQMGMSIGLSLHGFIPVSIFPRFDFMLRCMDSLINHLDKIESLSEGEFRPKVIIRTSVGATKPLNPGLQHCQDYTEALEKMCTNIQIVQLLEPCDVFRFYKAALNDAFIRNKSTILVEYGELYDNEPTR